MIAVSLVNAHASQKIYATSRFDVLLSLLIAAGLIAVCMPYNLGMWDSSALLIGVWLVSVLAYVIRQGFSLRTVLLANGCALCFILAFDLVFYIFLIAENALGNTSSIAVLIEPTNTRDFLMVGVCALACLFITALGKMLQGALTSSKQSERILWPLSMFLVFSLINEILDIASVSLLPNTNLILYFQLGCTVLLIMFCSVFSFTTAKLGREVFRESENIALDRKRRDQETQMRLYKMQADTDRLTGLASRRKGHELIEQYYRKQTSFVVAFIDVDGLKQLNDHHGHAAGDRYLATFATHLSQAVRDETTIRWGGDEFIVVAKGRTADDLIERFADIKGDVAVRGGIVPLRFSYGIATSHECNTADALISLADKRMYEQKRHAREEAAAAISSEQGNPVTPSSHMQPMASPAQSQPANFPDQVQPETSPDQAQPMASPVQSQPETFPDQAKEVSD